MNITEDSINISNMEKHQLFEIGKILGKMENIKGYWIFSAAASGEFIASVKIPEASLFDQMDHYDAVISALEFIHKFKITCTWSKHVKTNTINTKS